MSTEDTAPGDRPIIIQGGNSIYVRMEKKYKDDGDDPQGRKKYRYGDLDLVSITFGGNTYPLDKNSEITIRAKPSTSGGGGGGDRPDQSS